MDSISKEIQKIARVQARHRSKFMEEFGLKGCHASYLCALCAEPGISQERLSACICADKSNVARQLAMLEEMDYVRRAVDPGDKRVLLVYPTEKTLAIMPRIRQKQAEWEAYLTEPITPAERLQLSALLRKIQKQADDYPEKETL